MDKLMEGLCSNFLIHPKNKFLERWNIFISILLSISCMTTPLHLAFYDKSSFFFNSDPENKGPLIWDIFNNVIDLLFLADIIVTFNTMIYN